MSKKRHLVPVKIVDVNNKSTTVYVRPTRQVSQRTRDHLSLVPKPIFQAEIPEPSIDLPGTTVGLGAGQFRHGHAKVISADDDHIQVEALEYTSQGPAIHPVKMARAYAEQGALYLIEPEQERLSLEGGRPVNAQILGKHRKCFVLRGAADMYGNITLVCPELDSAEVVVRSADCIPIHIDH